MAFKVTICEIFIKRNARTKPMPMHRNTLRIHVFYVHDILRAVYRGDKVGSNPQGAEKVNGSTHCDLVTQHLPLSKILYFSETELYLNGLVQKLFLPWTPLSQCW